MDAEDHRHRGQGTLIGEALHRERCCLTDHEGRLGAWAVAGHMDLGSYGHLLVTSHEVGRMGLESYGHQRGTLGEASYVHLLGTLGEVSYVHLLGIEAAVAGSRDPWGGRAWLGFLVEDPVEEGRCEASRGASRDRYGERHLAVNDRDECREPVTLLVINRIFCTRIYALPSHHHIREAF